LAGNVTVRIDDGTLFLGGDNASNDIEIRIGGTDLLVTGRNNTRINGGTAPFRAASSQLTTHLFGDLKKGDDVVEVVGVRLTGKIQIKTRQGNDRIELNDLAVGEVMLDTDQGDDVVELQEVASTRDTWIFLGKGNDVLAAPSLTVGRNWRIKAPGSGSNSVAMGELQVTGNSRLDLGNGSDQLAFMDQSSFGGTFQMKGRSGNDTIAFDPSRGGRTATFQGPVKLDLQRGNDTVAFDMATTVRSSLEIRGSRGTDQVSGDVVNQVTNRRLSSIESRASADMTALVNSVLSALTRAGVDTSIFAADAAAPVVTTTAASASYTENAAAIPVDANVTVTDADGSLQSATVAIVSGFSAGQDVLAFTASAGITGSYNSATGVLTLTGTATVAAWQQVLRSVTYQNTSDDPSTAARVLRFSVSDGARPGTAERTIQVSAVDDPGSLQLPAEFSSSTPVQRMLGTPIDFTAMVLDLDDNDYVFMLDLEGSGIPQTATQPVINATTGRFQWTPTTTGTFTIRIIAVNGAGFADQETFVVEVTN
jgi:hypothetical protein